LIYVKTVLTLCVNIFMSNEYKEIINNINVKAEKLVSEYLKLKDINKTLIEEKKDLQIKLELEKEHFKDLLSKYENLKSGKVIDLTNNDVNLTKNKINGLVREIDSCIALLNVN